ncbi:EAL domain-containing response regulator [Massilia sp. RP-1-19]|uniref:EAL domain-containing response regulator n=1 Tax=Massilia polaris TaxID=2728846 RepID=A0A848HEA6_9BURK|nr:EAL domain-containing response regulator [Massilia polaris]NML59564.1 EAL domain-containing response regulator [Massilia polaris]
MTGCRLLILDDDESIARTVALIAGSGGAQSRVCTDAHEFLDLARSWNPSHLFVDLQMPQMDGLQVLSELASRGCPARIIISSGVGARVLEAAVLSAKELGLDVCGMLPKPFRLNELRALLFDAGGAPAKAADARGPSPSPVFMPAAADLEVALAQKNLFVVYQPKIHCSTGRVSGLEALVRWQHPDHGLVTPDRFIPLAEGAGLIDGITLAVLNDALPWFAKWSSDYEELGELTLSINISARSLGRPELIDTIVALCERSGVSPSKLIFELTETAAMDEPVAALTLLTRLRVHGFMLSLDDFGTGYSSMLQLVRLPFSELKIDRSFVASAATSQESRAVIRCITDLGRSLGMKTTAEGVEDSATHTYLQEIGCDLAQGYLFSRPLTPMLLANWMDKHLEKVGGN